MFVGRDMEVLATGCITPSDDAIFVEVWKEAINVIKRSSAGISDCNLRGQQWKSLMQWMKSVDKDSPSSSPFYLYNPPVRPPRGEQLLPHTHVNFPRGPCEGYRGSRSTPK
jgi:hypothetical protein